MRTIHTAYNDGVFDLLGSQGFNPKEPPMKVLPDEFSVLQDILQNMPIWKDFENKVPGYLAEEGRIQKEVERLPNYVDLIKQHNMNDEPMLFQALYRGYTFLASAYLLEPAHQHYVKTKNYGKALQSLPANIAVPLVYVAEQLEVHPFLDYHYAYSLGNYTKRDESGGLNWENIDMAVKFSGTPDETGFIMLHVDIDSLSPDLIKSIRKTVYGMEMKNIAFIQQGLQQNLDTMKEVNTRRKLMWQASNYKNYNNFRVFIMGITGNTEIFGDGVVYEGVEKYNGEKQQFRGQTGAQDDTIPTEDIFTGVIDYYPNNMLTKYLMELRDYRPQVVQRWLEDLRLDCTNDTKNHLLDIICSYEKNFSLHNRYVAKKCLINLLGIVEQIYHFRNGHWMFVQKYIMGNTKYAKATGGTPIISWIPNQIEACLEYMRVIIDRIESFETDGKNTENNVIDLTKKMIDYDEAHIIYQKIRENFKKYCKILKNQLEELKNKDFNVDSIYLMNDEFRELVE